jgi:23S rRNA-/tRNA-specific pseudouridylate synthase
MNSLTPTILFENENVLVINKPSGLVVHPDGRREGVTLIDWILETHPEIMGVGI